MINRGLILALLLLSACGSPIRATATPVTGAGGQTRGSEAAPPALRREVEALHNEMVAAFRRDPTTVARYYTDDASIMGGGARAVGREQVDRYWREGPRGEWTLEVLQVGGDASSPWVRGRSTLASTSGRRMVTDYVGILKRGSDGRLRFYVDMYVGAAGPMLRPSGGSR